MTRQPAVLKLGTRAALAALAAVAGLAAACEADSRAAPPGDPPAATGIPSPAAPGAGEPNLVAGSGHVLMSWIEPRGAGRHAIRFARWDGDGWSEPRTVVERGGLFVNWADFPSMIALDDGTLAAHWLERSGPARYAYDVRMSLSRDGGATWSPDLLPHRDGTQTEHGFVSLFPVDGRIGVVWLDGRAMVDDGPMALRFTTVDPGGELGEEEVLDGHVCECCQTGAAIAEAGPVVVYRGRTMDEVRDILITRRVDGQWTPGAPVHEDGWVIAGCPVNGPSVMARGSLVAVAWFTGAPSERVLVAFSRDGGATFGAPVRVDEGGAMGRVTLVDLDDDALVVWMERAGDNAEIRARRVSPHGVGPWTAIAPAAAARASGFPRVARLGESLLFAWTEAGDPSHVRTARAALDGAEVSP